MIKIGLKDFIIVFLVVISGIFIYNKNKLEKKYDNVIIENKTQKQNLEAELDSSRKTFKVIKIPNDTIIKTKYITKTITQTITDTAFVNITDSNNIIVNFSDVWKYGKYSGFTKYNQTTKDATYQISIMRDSIVYISKIYFDEQTKLLKNELYANNELISNVEGIIDENIYRRIITKEEKKSFIDNIIFNPIIEIDNSYNVNMFAKLGYYDNDIGGYLFIGKNSLGVGLTYNISYRSIIK